MTQREREKLAAQVSAGLHEFREAFDVLEQALHAIIQHQPASHIIRNISLARGHAIEAARRLSEGRS